LGDNVVFDIILGILLLSGIVSVLPFGFWMALFSKDYE